MRRRQCAPSGSELPGERKSTGGSPHPHLAVVGRALAALPGAGGRRGGGKAGEQDQLFQGERSPGPRRRSIEGGHSAAQVFLSFNPTLSFLSLFLLLAFSPFSLSLFFSLSANSTIGSWSSLSKVHSLLKRKPRIRAVGPCVRGLGACFHHGPGPSRNIWPLSLFSPSVRFLPW